MNYLGDFLIDETVYIYFSTNAADGGREDFSGGVILSSADFKIYRDDRDLLSDMASVTIREAFVTGLCLLIIDTSNNAGDDATYYEAGHEYAAVLYPNETLDSQSVSAVIGQWSIQNRYMRGTDGANTTTPNTTVPDVAGTAAALHGTTDGKIDTAQSDLNKLTGSDGATLATAQGKYAPAKAGDAMTLSNDAVSAAAIATDAITAIQSGLATESNVNSKHTATDADIAALNDPTVAAIADGVLLKLIADHSGTSGSLAEFIELIKDIAEADTVIDTSDATQWILIFNKKGTSTEIMRKNLLDITGAAVTATTAVLGAREHTT